MCNLLIILFFTTVKDVLVVIFLVEHAECFLNLVHDYKHFCSCGFKSWIISMFMFILKCELYAFSDGNGFKTSTMRLGADAIVFSRATRGR